MNFFGYISRVLQGLPSYDSIELIQAKRHQVSGNLYYKSLDYDLYYKDTDDFMFGAVTAKSDKSDSLTSYEIESRVAKLYESAR